MLQKKLQERDKWDENYKMRGRKEKKLDTSMNAQKSILNLNNTFIRNNC